MHFGTIDNYMLFGGGELLLLFARELARRQCPVQVVTSERHAREEVAKAQSLAALLEAEGIPFRVVQRVDAEEVVSAITTGTIGFSFGAAWIFKKPFIDLFQGRLLNMHCTRLPQNRGGGGYSWMIMNGEAIGSRVLHLIDCGIDTGHIVQSEEYLYPASCRRPIDYHENEKKGRLAFLARFLDGVREGREFELTTQQETFSSYFPRLNTDLHGFIDWSWEAGEIERFVCAFDEPYGGASTFCNERRVRLKDCRSMTCDGSFHPFQHGLVYRKSARVLFVAARGGTLAVERVCDDAGEDILDSISPGDRLYTPSEQLDLARLSKAVYLPGGMKK